MGMVVGRCLPGLGHSALGGAAFVAAPIAPIGSMELLTLLLPIAMLIYLARDSVRTRYLADDPLGVLS